MWETPPRSPTMVGIAVETMVWSRAAVSMPARRAPKIVLIRRRVRTIGVAPDAADSVVGASNCTPQGKDGAAGAAPVERPGGAGSAKADDVRDGQVISAPVQAGPRPGRPMPRR